MAAPVPEAIRPVLDEYLTLTEEKLPGFVQAFYLQGSIALGAFNERFSDIDFVAFISRTWTKDDLAILKEIHRSLKTTYPSWLLEGIYLEWPGLTEAEKIVRPYLNYHDDVLEPLTEIEINDVNWWVLKNRGIAIKGPAAQELGFEVEWPVLLAWMKHNHHTYWSQFTTNPRRVAYMLSDEGLQWAVLGVLRQFYSFKEQDITSKTGAGQYALQHLPPKWHRLIQEAINIREKEQPSLYKSKVLRTNEAVRFLKYVIKLSNSLP